MERVRSCQFSFDERELFFLNLFIINRKVDIKGSVSGLVGMLERRDH